MLSQWLKWLDIAHTGPDLTPANTQKNEPFLYKLYK